MNWNDNSEYDLAGYNVYRSTTSGGPYTKLNRFTGKQSLITSTSMLPIGTTYYYVVTAVDTVANESYASNEA